MSILVGGISMFLLDKLVIKWIVAKCAQLGGAFMLGPFEGFIMYLAIIGLGVAKVMEVREGKKK